MSWSQAIPSETLRATAVTPDTDVCNFLALMVHHKRSIVIIGACESALPCACIFMKEDNRSGHIEWSCSIYR
ncbi:uncharacterized protein YALI1_F05290g [Yarrowia lipolytica]|uniref:Uncharacterized protein n=1 Tax=Yarrowia lipolytica TaxID=4952 RepID=A0A1D8NLX1_YARLL|nr:hypothetical protein YALI1_F05290g [Yarrowia lipolytica]